MTVWRNPKAREIIRDRVKRNGWEAVPVGGSCYELRKTSARGRLMLINVEFIGGELIEANSDIGFAKTTDKLGWVLRQLDRNRS